MFYTVYKITNLVNNKIYIGVHKTSDLEDDYMGSGLLIRKSIEKYGLENFKKEYISIFDNAEAMFNMESELVNEEFINREDTYNLKQGGYGGFDFLNKSGLNNNDPYGKKFKNDVRNKKISESIKHQYKNLVRISPFVELHKNGKAKYDNFVGKTHSLKSILQMKESHKDKHNGEKNSQFGTIWIFNIELNLNKKIKKEEFDAWKQDGWIKGRKIKN